MAVTTTAGSITYVSDGVDLIYAYPFRILTSSGLKVYQSNTAGVYTLLEETLHYSVSGVGDEGGGNITLVTAVTEDCKLAIVRASTVTQELELTENGPFPAGTIEEALDGLTMAIQGNSAALGKALSLPPGSDISNLIIPDGEGNEGRVLAWNTLGDAIECIEYNPTTLTTTTLSADLTGDLDVAGYKIVSATNGNIEIDPHGTGVIKLTADTVQLGDALAHTGDLTNTINFTAGTQTFKPAGASIMDLTTSGVRMGATGARVTQIDNDTTLAADSGTRIPTQTAVKTYVDTLLSPGQYLSGVSVFTADDTWTRPAGCTTILIYVTGGGGGGGSAYSSSASYAAAGGSGSGGGTAIKYLVSPDASYVVTIGQGGAGGSLSSGAAGGDTTFGAVCTGGGGNGGGYVSQTSGTAQLVALAAGGVGTNGDINIAGGDGGYGYGDDVTTMQVTFVTGSGGSYWGPGTPAVMNYPSSTLITIGGFNGPTTSYGAGGGGGSVTASATADDGGDGADGICVVYEYTSF